MNTATQLSGLDKWRALVLSFPELRKHLDADVLPEDLARWLRGPAVTSGSLWAGRFCLLVWSGDVKSAAFWRAGPFDVVTAMSVWDWEHRAAFLAWCQAPWWP